MLQPPVGNRFWSSSVKPGLSGAAEGQAGPGVGGGGTENPSRCGGRPQWRTQWASSPSPSDRHPRELLPAPSQALGSPDHTQQGKGSLCRVPAPGTHLSTHSLPRASPLPSGRPVHPLTLAGRELALPGEACGPVAPRLGRPVGPPQGPMFFPANLPPRPREPTSGALTAPSTHQHRLHVAD